MSNNRYKFFSATTIFILGLSGAEAQRPAQIPRIGILIPESGRAESQSVKGLRDGLKELGYKERENIVVEMRDAKGDRAALKPMANELVSKKADLIFTTGTRATQAAIAATSEIPIVFRYPGNPQTVGLVKSNARPGGNVTGVAGFGLEMTGKRLETLKQIVPGVRRVHIFYDLNDRFSRDNFALAKKSAANLGLEVMDYGIKSAEELKTSFGNLQSGPGDALFQVPDNLVDGEADFIFQTARQKKLPTMFNEEVWAIKGALGAYGPSNYQMGRQAADFVDKILKGQKPENLPVEAARKFDLVINFRTANAIGLTISPDMLKKADRVIR
ncbi:MAG TPA: ABC transporter substrate-binding protein [Candidatus Binatia bacterium]|nr:ABC transporter substrate-binding protein [Candidatus Binatia bacterium]